MKKVGIIIVILFVLGLIGAGVLLLSPNYKKGPNEGKTNLVINYTNVTSTMKGSVFIEDGDVYISKESIENYYDRYIYYDEQYNLIVIAKGDKTVCFDIAEGTMDINGTKTNAKVIEKDGYKYVPISKLEDVYNIKVHPISNSKIIVVESMDRQLEVSEIKKGTKLRLKRTSFSRGIEKLAVGDKVAIVPNQNNTKGYTYVRTQDGNLGYVKDDCLSSYTIEREAAKTEENGKKVSLLWDYFESSAPRMDYAKKYDGVNVVSPSLFYMNSSTVKNRIDDNGVNYIRWAKNNNYEIWPMISNNNYSEDQMKEFSSWINDYKKRKNVIDQIIKYVEDYKIDGINIDFENMYLKDKNGFSRFVIELKPALANVGAKLSVDVTEPDGSENWSLCFNRNVIGDVADYIVFMAYDQYGRGSNKAGPTAACYWVERNINKFLSQEEVKPNKIILGIPLYSVLWKEKDGEVSGTAIPQKNISIPNGVETTWLEDSKQNYMEYTQGGYTCKMWIEDTEATSQKLDFIKQYNLAGAAFWQKGFEDPNVWNLVEEKLAE